MDTQHPHHCKVFLWEAYPGRETFHNRYLLTAQCGISVPAGLDWRADSTPNSTTRLLGEREFSQGCARTFFILPYAGDLRLYLGCQRLSLVYSRKDRHLPQLQEVPDALAYRDAESVESALATVTIDLPEEVFSALRRSPEEFVREMRLAAAIHWYGRGEISPEKAAQMAGLERTDFLLTLGHERADAFVVDIEDLKRELGHG
jgi:predicted HTH domain antitoxin